MSVLRCGSITVDLALKFNSTTKEQDVIITLNDAVKDGKLGEFSVGAIKGKRSDMEPTGGVVTSPLDRSYGGKSPKHFIKKFCKLIYECPCPALGCEHIFCGVKKKVLKVTVFNSKLVL